jgi:hypothetical protein
MRDRVYAEPNELVRNAECTGVAIRSSGRGDRMSLLYSRWSLCCLAALGAAACGESPPGDGPPSADQECGPDEFVGDAGECRRAGVPAAPACAPGEIDVGGCRAAGVDPSACAPGFVADQGGCAAIMPPSACPEGQMALPGEVECREVQPCGAGPWPVLPDGATSIEYVDEAFVGTSDGSEANPWTTIQAAVDAADDDAWIAVAAGTYQEAVEIENKRLHLIGLCPSEVSVVGVDGPALFVADGASGTEIRGMAFSGASLGVLLSGSEDVVLDQVWIHDTGARGINAESTLGTTSFRLTRSLVERATELALFVSGVDAAVMETTVRDTRPTAGGDLGRGLNVRANPPGDRPYVEVLRSVFERNADAAIMAFGARVRVEATLIRDAQPSGADQTGLALAADRDPKEGARSEVVAVSSVFERCLGYCVVVSASDLELDGVTIRDTSLDATGAFGWGLDLQSHPPTLGRASALVKSSLIERSVGVGVRVSGSDLVLEGSVVRDVILDQVERSGLGIFVHPDVETQARSTLHLRRSVVERARGAAVHVRASDAFLEGSVLRDIDVLESGFYGRGLEIGSAYAEVRGCLIERTHEIGLAAIASELLVETSEIRDVQPNGEGRFGDGLAVVTEPNTPPGRARISDTRIEGVARAGISSFGGQIAFGRTVVGCSGFDIEAEHYAGASFSFEKLDDNRCGCPTPDDECQVLSGGLEAPSALPTTP